MKKVLILIACLICVSSFADNEKIKLIQIDRLSIKDGLSIEFPFIIKWVAYSVPNSQAKPAYKEILSELKQIAKALEIGISYNKFCDLIQEKALSIEKIKDKTDLPPTQDFLKHANTCITYYTTFRDIWGNKIKHGTSESALLLEQIVLTHAGIEILYCTGIVDSNPQVNDSIIANYALCIYIDETKLNPIMMDGKFTHPVLSKMNAEEILQKIKKEVAKADK